MISGTPGEDDEGEVVYVPVLGPLNSERLSDYHRLDLRASRQWRLPGKLVTFFIDVQNVYDRANLAGFEVPGDRRIDGIDQTALLLGKRETDREHFYFGRAGVRQGKWKYLKPDAHFHGYAVEDDRPKVEELYDLEADLGERNNLAAKHPEKVAALRTLMESIEGKDAAKPGLDTISIKKAP